MERLNPEIGSRDRHRCGVVLVLGSLLVATGTSVVGAYTVAGAIFVPDHGAPGAVVVVEGLPLAVDCPAVDVWLARGAAPSPRSLPMATTSPEACRYRPRSAIGAGGVNDARPGTTFEFKVPAMSRACYARPTIAVEVEPEVRHLRRGSPRSPSIAAPPVRSPPPRSPGPACPRYRCSSSRRARLPPAHAQIRPKTGPPVTPSPPSALTTGPRRLSRSQRLPRATGRSSPTRWTAQVARPQISPETRPATCPPRAAADLPGDLLERHPAGRRLVRDSRPWPRQLSPGPVIGLDQK